MKQLQNAINMRLASLMVGGLSLSDLKREDGQTFAEYALVIGVISVGIAGLLAAFNTQIQGVFTDLGNSLDALV